MELRPYQKDCVRADLNAFGEGVRGTMNVLPTGTGKTHIQAELVRRAICTVGKDGSVSRRPNRKPALYLAHREELINQGFKTLTKMLPRGTFIDVEMAVKKASPAADVVVASVPTIGRKDSNRLAWLAKIGPSVIIVDEAHHAEASTYINVAERFGRFDLGRKVFVAGFTATPKPLDNAKSDGKVLWEQEVYRLPLLKAIRDGWLCPIRAVRVVTDTDLAGVKVSAGDFNARSLADAVDTHERTELVVREWVKEAHDRITVAFCADVAHAKHTAEEYQRAGVKAAWVSGEKHLLANGEMSEGMPREQARQIIAAWKRGEIQVVANCGLLTEGFDYPAINCVVMLRPTKSWVLYAQCVGRGTRICEGKEDLLVIDAVDVTTRLDIATAPTLIDLPADFDMAGNDLESIATAYSQAVDEGKPVKDARSLSDIKTATVSVDLFGESQLPEEVQAHSELSWIKVAGAYMLSGTRKTSVDGLPNQNLSVTGRLTQDSVGLWTLRIENRAVPLNYGDLPDFKNADSYMMQALPDSMQLMKSKARWHGEPMTSAQKGALSRMGVPKGEQGKLDRGSASRLITLHKTTGWKYGMPVR